MTDSSSIVFRPMDHADIDSVTSVISTGFLHEPMGVRTNVQLSRLERFVRCFASYGVNGLSCVAYDRDSDRLAAALLVMTAQDEHALPPSLYEPFSGTDDYGPIISILSDLNSMYSPPSDAKVAHLWMASCLPEYRKSRIFSQLVTFTVDACIANGYTHLISECTGIYSYSNAIRMGFRPMAAIEYDTYRYGEGYPLRFDPAASESARIDTSMHKCVTLMLLTPSKSARQL